MTQSVAYDAQLSDRRSKIHAALARTLAEIQAEKLDERAALIAYHFEEAGESLAAARWNGRAAEVVARDLGGPDSALRHWRNARSLLAEAPDTEERAGL